jgi:hypothetical protein
LLFFSARDGATAGSPNAVAPGSRAPSVQSPELRKGNLVLLAAPPSLSAARRLADDMAGPADAALRDAGQAVLVLQGPARGVVAQAWERELRVGSVGDPRLRAFLEYWLGRAAG